MFLNINSDCSDLDLNHQKNNPIIFERLLGKDKNITRYSNTTINLSSIDRLNRYSQNTQPRSNKATPETLKKAMFKMSSRGIAAQLLVKE